MSKKSIFDAVCCAVATKVEFYAKRKLGLLRIFKEAFEKDCDNCNDSVDFKTMLLLAIATSIDALAVGVSFAFLGVNIWQAVVMIGVITMIISMIGLRIGNIFGCRYKSKAEIFGGCILLLMGCKILIEHLSE